MNSAHRQVADIAVIIPVWREEAAIAGVLANVLDEQTVRPAEVIVADGDPEGSTLAAVEREEPLLLQAPRGRALQMNAGAEAASAGTLLFLHADTVLPPDGVAATLAALQDPKIWAGAFRLHIDSADPRIRAIGWLANRRVAWNRIPFGDQALFCRAAFFHNSGGFPEIPLMEDLEFMRRIPQRRKRVALVDASVQTSARRWEREGPLRCSLRNIVLRSAYRLGVNPSRLARWYG